jgi:dephospho-CoA kinase
MSLFLINGSAGTGKSTVCKVLKEKGYSAYDVDDDALARWVNNETGFIHPKSSVKSDQRTPEFIATHGWRVPIDEVKRIKQESEGSLAFLCGSFDLDGIVDMFSGIFSLHVDDKELRHRISTRTNNNWGKQEHELNQTLADHQTVYEGFKALGAIIIDASREPEQVAEDILKRVESYKEQ